MTRQVAVDQIPFGPVIAELASVEARLHAIPDVDHPILSQTLRLILGPEGKRLRPALVLLTSGMHGAPIERRERLAMAVELLHTATLVHDDIIDESPERRGQATINTVFGNSLAVLTGDYLFAKAAELVASLNSPAIMGVFAWAVMELCQGEMLPLGVNGDLPAAEATYFAKIRSKTASLFAMCCETGAMLDNADATLVTRLRHYGLQLGVAFQIMDDILDLTGTEAELGKPVGSDLLQGVTTLPVIYFLADQPQHPLAHMLSADGAADEAQVAEVVAEIRDSAAIARARAVATRYAHQAAACLDGLPAREHTQALAELVDFVIHRRG